MIETKTCSACSKEKPVDLFSFRNKRRATRNSHCKECINKHATTVEKSSRFTKVHNDRIEKRKAVYEYLLQHPCKCGESDPAALQFDHKDGEQKVAAISAMTSSGCSLRRILAEIEKCEVVCANCHSKRTAKQFKWYEGFLAPQLNQVVEDFTVSP